VAGLAHDLGHPPFGHAGEKALQEHIDRFRDRIKIPNEYLLELLNVQAHANVTTVDIRNEKTSLKPLEEIISYIQNVENENSERANHSFEGNAQSMRIVASLALRDSLDRSRGLDLTLRSLASIAKYPWTRGEHPSGRVKLKNKWSFYPEEKSILDELQTAGYVKTHQDSNGRVVAVDRWIEAEIMDWADDISYAVHDLDDFYRAGLIPLGQIAAALATDEIVDWLNTDFYFVRDAEIAGGLSFAIKEMKHLGTLNDYDLKLEIPKALTIIANMLKELPSNNFSGSRDANISIRKLSSSLIEFLENSTSLLPDSQMDRVQLKIDDHAVLVAEFFKALNKYFVIDTVILATLQYGQEHAIVRIYEELTLLTSRWLDDRDELFDSKRLPARLRAYIDDETENTPYSIGVAILDYVSGLRDRQVMTLDQRMSGSVNVPALAGRWLDT